MNYREDEWGLDTHDFAALVANGNVSYCLRVGKHDLTLWDWNRYMDFADAHGWSHR